VRQMAKKKRPLSTRDGMDGGPAQPPEGKKDGPWWNRTDAELMAERYREVRSSLGLERVKLDDDDRKALVEEARRRDPNLKNLLDVVFERSEGIGRDGEFLTVPIFRTARGERIARMLRLRTVRRVRLDRYGWAVWGLLDGRRDVGEVGAALGEVFGEGMEPMSPRLSKFLAYLIPLGLVRERS